MGSGNRVTPETDSKRPRFWWWPIFSIGCGVMAIVALVGIMLIPSNRWRVIVGGLLGVGVAVSWFVMWRNPRWFYRRMLSLVIAAWLLVHAVGFGLRIVYDDGGTKAGIYWDSTVGWGFTIAGALIIIVLTVADLRRLKD